MVQFVPAVDDSDLQPSADFLLEEDTWVLPRRQLADPAVIFFHYIATMNDQLTEIVDQLQEHAAERDRIVEMATRLDEANRQLEELVMTDALTGVGNRRMFVDRLSLRLAEAERGADLMVFLIDVDDFKVFNDTFGHSAGDEALKSVAQALSSVIRKVDCFARYGGEEFVLASSVPMDGAKVLADKLLAAVREISLEHRAVTISIGMTAYRDGDSLHSIIGRADFALYDAKRAGKNRAVMFEDIGRELCK